MRCLKLGPGPLFFFSNHTLWYEKSTRSCLKIGVETVIAATGLQCLLLISFTESSAEDKPRVGTVHNDWWRPLGARDGLISRFLLLIFQRSLHLNYVKENLMTLSRRPASCRANSLRQIAEDRLQARLNTYRIWQYESAFHIEPCQECVPYGFFLLHSHSVDTCVIGISGASRHFWFYFLPPYGSSQTLQCERRLHKGTSRKISARLQSVGSDLIKTEKWENRLSGTNNLVASSYSHAVLVSIQYLMFSSVRPEWACEQQQQEEGATLLQPLDTSHLIHRLPPGTQRCSPARAASWISLPAGCPWLLKRFVFLFFYFLRKEKKKPLHRGFHNVLNNNELRLNPLFAFVIREDGWKERGWSVNSIIALD